MAINEASLIMVKDDQLLDTTTVASLAILLSSAGVTQMHKMPGPKVRVVVTKAVAIIVMVMLMVMSVGRPIIGPMPWMPMRSRGIAFISLKGINQGHLVIVSIGLIRLSRVRSCSLQSIA